MDVMITIKQCWKLYILPLAMAITVTACGGGGGNGNSSGDTPSPSDPPPQTPPTLVVTGTPSPAQEDQLYSYSFSVNRDSDFTAENLPSWASLNSATGEITGTPTNDDVGISNNISITATARDNGDVDVIENLSLEVINSNDPPTISGGNQFTSTLGEAFSATFSINDIDVGDNLVITANLPDWLSINSDNPAMTQLFGTPTDSGTYDADIQITDGNMSNPIIFSVSIMVTMGGQSNASAYPGIPAPDGQVPAAIMPSLPPTGGYINAFPYDPITLATPTWSNAENQFWVDETKACDNDNNDGRGSPDAPRCTLPGISGSTWTLAEGSQVFIVGNGASYGDGADINTLQMPGTTQNPIWVIGVNNASTPRWSNQAKLEFDRFFLGDSGQYSHVIMENLHFYSANDNFRGSWATNNNSSTVEYLTFRKITCSGSGTDDLGGTFSSGSRRCFVFNGDRNNPIRFVSIIDSDIFGLGRWLDDYDTSVDLIGMHLQGATYYVWYLNNRSYRIQGDSIHCNNSNQWDFEYNRRPHYVYIAGSEFHSNYENAYDSKGCYHVVFSSNTVHNFHNSVKGANDTAIIAANDAESYVGSNFEWFINNRIYNVGNPFAYKGTQTDAYVYFIGNLVTDVIDGAAIQVDARCRTQDGTTTCGDGMYVAQNTFDCNKTSFSTYATRSGTSGNLANDDEEQHQEMTFIGNLYYNCNDSPNADSNPSPHGWETINSNFLLRYNYNIDFRDTNPSDIQLSAFNDEEVGNLTNIDPLLANPTGDNSGDYQLEAGSSARSVVPEPDAFTLFKNLYGLEIREDINGNTWTESSPLNIGAFQ